VIKRVNILLLGIFLGNIIYAQTIDSITYSPKNPTWEDTIIVSCHIKYPNTGCALNHHQQIFGTQIMAYSYHCCGSGMSMLVPFVDTFHVVPFDSYEGTYTFYYISGYMVDTVCNNFPVNGNGDTLPYPNNIGSIEIPVVNPINSVENKQGNNSSFNVYPNPTTGLISLTALPKKYGRITVYDVLGELVHSRNLNELNEVSIDLSGFPGGLYLIQLQYGQMVLGKKVIKQ